MTDKKPKPPRKPEEVWYDVHKHPEGVPGGMGKSPEYHLRNRGWVGHEINEGSGKKTIQYRNHSYPDFVISYGGGTSTKPDHNFRVLYMGTNRNIPKVHNAYSVADAMNKVEELNKLQSGLVVQPMTAHQAGARPPYTMSNPPPDREPRQFVAPNAPDKPPITAPGYQIGKPRAQFPKGTGTDEDETAEPNPGPQLKQIPNAPAPSQAGATKYGAGPSRMQNDHGTLAGGNRHKTAGEALCPLCAKVGKIYRRDPGLYRDLVESDGGLLDEHQHVASPFHDRIQEALISRRGLSRRHPEGLGPADLGRSEYQRQYRVRNRAKDDLDVANLARGYGMDLAPEEVRNYRGLRGVVSVFRLARQETWEEA